MHETKLTLPGRGLPASLSPRERSALHRRWRPVVPLVIAVMSLVLLVLLLLRVEEQTRRAVEGFTEVVDPARAAVTAIELTLALESSDAAGFLLTGNSRFTNSHADERGVRMRAEHRLAALSHQLGPNVAPMVARLTQHLAAGDATMDSLYQGRISRPDFGARLDAQRARFASIIEEAANVEKAIVEAAAIRRREFAASQRLAAVLSSVLAIGAFIALALVARLAAGFQARAIRLDAREQQQNALREVARALNASVSLAESAAIVAEGALAATVAIAAIVELAGETDSDRMLWTGAAMRGRPPQSTSVPFDESITRIAADSFEAIAIGADTLLDRLHVPQLMRGTAMRGTIVPVVSNGQVRGALAVVRPATQSRTSQSEDSYLGALMELASSMLWRVELVSELRASEERFRQVADNIRGFVWLRAPDSSRFLYANPAYEDIWGRSRASLYQDPMSWVEGVHPEDRDRVLALMSPAPVESFELEFRVVRPNGEVRWVSSRGFPVRDEQGRIYRMAGFTEDVTERREAELARERLIESRARLVRGFTHDVKNPLGAADGFLALLEEGVFGALTDDQSGSISRARGSIHRALELITGALELARTDIGQLELHREIVDLRKAIHDVTLEYHGQAEAKRQTLTAKVEDDVPAITSDSVRIRQIVANLLSNAIKYTPEEGRIDVRTSLVDERDDVPGEWVMITVTDTGRGIAVEELPKLFQEFTRLHPEIAGGAGVGLAISQRLARALGGSITVKSRVGEGSTFTLWLPRDRRVEDRRSPPVAA